MRWWWNKQEGAKDDQGGAVNAAILESTDEPPPLSPADERIRLASRSSPSLPICGRGAERGRNNDQYISKIESFAQVIIKLT
jgi:hypothetical protein